MKKFYFILLCACLYAVSATAQTGSVVVPADLNPIGDFPATNLGDFIDSDDSTNLTFVLERGGLYYFSGRKEYAFDVRIVAAEPLAADDPGMPMLQRFNPGSTNLPDIYRGTGSLTFIGIHFIMGEEQPDASNYENAPIRPFGVNQRYIFKDCILEKARQAIARIEGDGSKSYVENCIIRNFGDYEQFQGNGRLIDVRTTFADSVVIRDNVIHNILDRLYIGFRQRGNNYFEFSSNTVFNHVGRHGLIQLGSTKDAKIVNNLFVNPKMMGTTPSISDEQLGVKDDSITFLFTSQDPPEGASIDMRNNNIFYTEDVLAYFESADTVMQSPVLGPNFRALLGDTTDAYFSDPLELNNVPSREPVLRYTMEAINDRSSTDLTDIMVEPIERMGSAFDKGYLFDFSTFDPCYDNSTASATGATDGGRVGARTICGETTVSNRNVLRINRELNFLATPNPAGNATVLSYELAQSDQVNIQVFDLNGRRVAQLFSGRQSAGSHTVDFSTLNQLPTGMYIAHLFTAEEGRMVVRIVKN